MLDIIIPPIKDILFSEEDGEIITGFPSRSNVCQIGEQVSDILQYSGSINNYLSEGSIINPTKCNTAVFQTKYGDTWGCFHYIRGENSKLHSELYDDATYYLALDYDGVIIAFLGFNINDSGIPEVIQIQGAKLFGKNFGEEIRNNWYLNNFNWKKYLVTEFIHFIKSHRIGTQVKIQSAKNNSWGEISSFANRQPGKRGFETYDQIAIDLGFNGSPEDGYTLKL